MTEASPLYAGQRTVGRLAGGVSAGAGVRAGLAGPPGSRACGAQACVQTQPAPVGARVFIAAGDSVRGSRDTVFVEQLLGFPQTLRPFLPDPLLCTWSPCCPWFVPRPPQRQRERPVITRGRSPSLTFRTRRGTSGRDATAGPALSAPCANRRSLLGDAGAPADAVQAWGPGVWLLPRVSICPRTLSHQAARPSSAAHAVPQPAAVARVARAGLHRELALWGQHLSGAGVRLPWSGGRSHGHLTLG